MTTHMKNFYDGHGNLVEMVIWDDEGPTEFGDTCPVLKVARKHGIPYETALMIADRLVYGKRLSPEVYQASKLHRNRRRMRPIIFDLGRVARRFVALREGRETL